MAPPPPHLCSSSPCSWALGPNPAAGCCCRPTSLCGVAPGELEEMGPWVAASRTGSGTAAEASFCSLCWLRWLGPAHGVFLVQCGCSVAFTHSICRPGKVGGKSDCCLVWTQVFAWTMSRKCWSAYPLSFVLNNPFLCGMHALQIIAGNTNF